MINAPTDAHSTNEIGFTQLGAEWHGRAVFLPAAF